MADLIRMYIYYKEEAENTPILSPNDLAYVLQCESIARAIEREIEKMI